MDKLKEFERLIDASEAAHLSFQFNSDVDGCKATRTALLEWARATLDAPEHSHKHVPSVERVRSSHTQMSTAAFLEKSPHGHRTYTQGQDESCYLCALLAEIDNLRLKADAKLGETK